MSGFSGSNKFGFGGGGGSGGGGNTPPVEITEAGDFTLDVAAGTVIEYIIANGTTNLLIGTNPNGDEIYNGTLEAGLWNTITLFVYFDVLTTLYFSGVTTTTTYKIYER